jgi:hypothetical protein
MHGAAAALECCVSPRGITAPLLGGGEGWEKIPRCATGPLTSDNEAKGRPQGLQTGTRDWLQRWRGWRNTGGQALRG